MKLPFMRRNASVTAKATRLLPSTERVIHSQALHERGGFLDKAIVVAELRAQERRGQGAGVAETAGAAELLDQGIVYGNGLLDAGELMGHWASNSRRRRFLATLAR